MRENFHGVVSSRRRHNSIVTIDVNDVQVDEVVDVQEIFFTHFENHFQTLGDDRFGVKKINLFLDYFYKELVKPFSEE